jgi:starvation-inducible DNA-binding protein
MHSHATKMPHRTVAAAAAPACLGATAVAEISARLNAALADMFAPFFKTKNFHWHMTRPRIRYFVRSLKNDFATE